MLSVELKSQIEQAMQSQKTPDWLYQLRINAVKRAHTFEKYSAFQANLNLTDLIASINLESPRIVQPTNDLLVVFRGPVREVKYLAGRQDRRIATLDPETLVTIVTNSFPTVRTHASSFLEFLATFD